MPDLNAIRIVPANPARPLTPQQKRFNSLVRQIEQARKGWTRDQHQTLQALACDAAGELLQADGDDAQLRALFAKHADVDFDTERAEALRAIKAQAEQATGLDLGDDEGILSQDDLLQRMTQRMQAHLRAQGDEREDQASRRPNAAQQRREALAHKPRNRCARSFASWPARCTRTASPTLSSAQPRPR